MTTDFTKETAERILFVLSEWERQTGIKIDSNTIRFRMDGEENHHIKLKYALEADPSGFAAVCVLEHIAANLNEKPVPLSELRFGASEGTQKTLYLLGLIDELRNNVEVKTLREKQNNRIQNALTSLNVLPEKKAEIQKIIQGPDFGHFIVQANNWAKNCSLRQFASGPARQETFHVNEWVHTFKDINAIIRATSLQPVDGVTLSLLLDNPLEYSTFLFALKAGDNIYLASEDNGVGHPEQKTRRRNPGRDLVRRQDSDFFPWSLFDFDVVPTASGSSEQYRISVKDQSAVVAYNEEITRTKKIADLEVHEILWAVLISDKLREKLWVEPFQTELSYSSQMLQLLPENTPSSSTELVLSGSSGLVLREKQNHIILQNPKVMNFGRFPTKSKGINDHLLKTYAEELKEIHIQGQGKLDIDNETNKAEIDNFDTRISKFGDTDDFVTFLSENNITGTNEEISALYMYESRKKLAANLQAILNREYNSNYEKIIEFLWSRFNRPGFSEFIRKAAINGGLIEYGRAEESFGWKEDHSKEANFLNIQCAENLSGFYYLGTQECFGWIKESKKASKHCIQAGRTKNIKRYQFLPKTNRGLCVLLGLKHEELPRELKHWSQEDPYVGNSILNTIDAVDRVKNPWKSLHIGFAFFACDKTIEKWKKSLAENRPFKPLEVQLLGPNPKYNHNPRVEAAFTSIPVTV